MKDQSDSYDQAEPQAPATRADARPESTRRSFLGRVGRKAAYVAPLVLILSASEAAQAASPSCMPSGGACTVDAECCTGMCNPGMMECI